MERTSWARWARDGQRSGAQLHGELIAGDFSAPRAGEREPNREMDARVGPAGQRMDSFVTP